jgi:hypothetical protein
VEENCKEVLEILDNINEILSGEKDPPDLNISYYESDQFMFYFFPDRQTPIFLNEICKLSNLKNCGLNSVFCLNNELKYLYCLLVAINCKKED